ncbi:MAG: M20/M25/M40 family metallo-hydrolase [Acholeplasmataceae bacterium]
MPWLYSLLIIPVLIIIIVYRTIRFRPIDYPEMKKWHDFDHDHAVESLSKMIQFATVSNVDSNKENQEIFADFRNFIQKRYPNIMGVATYEEIKRGMLFKIPGESDEYPVVLMSHYDVVPAQEGWLDHPFSGKITDTHIYGRGTLDTKSTLNAVMESVEYVLGRGKVFKHDLYLAFSGDEEIYGPSAPEIVKTLKDRGVVPYMVLDEGGAIISKMFPGVKDKVAVVGIAEKGYMNVKLTATSRGGHASTPPKQTPITELSKAIKRLNYHPSFRLRLTKPVKELFETVAPHSSSFAVRMLFSNLWLFMPLVKMIAKKSSGEFLAMFKTTLAFTLAEGSQAVNVLPSEATIGINIRLRSGETSDVVLRKMKKIIKNPNINVEATDVSEATPISKVDDAFDRIRKAVNATWSDVIVSPYLMVATTDSRHYHEICDHVYKFSPMDVSKADLDKIHGYDEDISIDNVIHGINFYINILEQL